MQDGCIGLDTLSSSEIWKPGSIGRRINAGVCFGREKSKNETDIFLSNVNGIFDEKRKKHNSKTSRGK